MEGYRPGLSEAVPQVEGWLSMLRVAVERQERRAPGLFASVGLVGRLGQVGRVGLVGLVR